jgi:hypothetical protein
MKKISAVGLFFLATQSYVYGQETDKEKLVAVKEAFAQVSKEQLSMLLIASLQIMNEQAKEGDAIAQGCIEKFNNLLEKEAEKNNSSPEEIFDQAISDASDALIKVGKQEQGAGQ